ncbi:DUF262 domain-containing protein [Vibrio splendidus]|uniref:DUF262 domain-containing protein n=1 Tax=Vibrio splendidus TaxID=29497 RepID=UPI000D3572DC|nr:DUF262 domain-containing protein [Vibrio splendidus]PTP52273.1 hypothetical protein CWO05_15195 [Vibrio splendidus]
MQFSDVLFDIEQLVGKQLQSLNPKTASIFITRIDSDSKKYFIQSVDEEREHARSLWELEAIWFDLKYKGFSNVDQALYGSGSSRNQPETVYANLPYIQHFKYKNKKHILLRDGEVHEHGTLSEISGSELRELRKKINRYYEVDIQELHANLLRSYSEISSSLDSVFKKFPGDTLTKKAEQALKLLNVQVNHLDEAIVNIDDKRTDNHLHTIENKESISPVSANEIVDDETVTGIENEIITVGDFDSENCYEFNDSNSVTNMRPSIRHFTPTVALMFDRLQFDEIELQPDFQRKDRIWSHSQKSKLIESLLLGLPLPAFYFGEKFDGSWVVVDGLQRITTLFDFISSDFYLTNLSFLPEYNGLYFKNLNRNQQRQVKEYQLSANVIELNSHSENLIKELFHRINTYGIHLSNQEIRNALYQGTSTRFLRLISASDSFIKATHNGVKNYRQKDMELCLHAISFMHLGIDDFVKDYNDFFDQALKSLNQEKLDIVNMALIDDGKAYVSESSSPIYYKLYNDFKRALDFAYEIFGELTFKKSSVTSLPINRSIFEITITYFSRLSDRERRLILNYSSEFVTTFYKAIESDSMEYAVWHDNTSSDMGRGFSFSITTSVSKPKSVKYRFEAFGAILKQTTGVDIKI